MDTQAIEQSLELAAAAVPDLTPQVYAHLFAAHPDMEALFVRDSDGAVRGEMLSRVFEMILDFIDRRSYGANMIQCEVVTHEGYGVPPDVFGLFFDAVANTLREVVGADWTPAMSTAWAVLLDDLKWFAEHPAQSQEPLLAPAERPETYPFGARGSVAAQEGRRSTGFALEGPRRSVY